MHNTNTSTEEWGNIELPGLSDEKLFKKNWHRYGRVLETFKKMPKEFYIERGKKISQSKLTKDHPTRGKKLPTEWLNSMSKSLKGHKKKNTSNMNKSKKKPLMTPDGPFDSTKSATIHYGFKWAENCSHKIKKGHPGWYWITIEEYKKLTGKDV